jgi:hypothetical protein
LLDYLDNHREASNRGPHRQFLPMPLTPPCFAPVFFDDEGLRIVRASMDDRVVTDQWGCDAPVRGSSHHPERVHGLVSAGAAAELHQSDRERVADQIAARSWGTAYPEAT